MHVVRKQPCNYNTRSPDLPKLNKQVMF